MWSWDSKLPCSAPRHTLPASSHLNLTQPLSPLHHLAPPRDTPRAPIHCILFHLLIIQCSKGFPPILISLSLPPPPRPPAPPIIHTRGAPFMLSSAMVIRQLRGSLRVKSHLYGAGIMCKLCTHLGGPSRCWQHSTQLDSVFIKSLPLTVIAVTLWDRAINSFLLHYTMR